MRDRAIDLALIVGLVLVASAIVWTLFSLGGPTPATPPVSLPGASDGPGRSGDDSGVGSGIVPVDPSDGAGAGDGAGGAAGAGSQPSDAAAGAVAGAARDAPADTAAGADAASDAASGGAGPRRDRPDPEIPAASAPPVPESGTVALGRVGFSYVTGGAGACGIVLEPWRHVAVSRELLSAYGCGAEVTVTLDDVTDGRTTVSAVVADTMNESFSRTANIYVAEDEPALQYGLTSGTIRPR